MTTADSEGNYLIIVLITRLINLSNSLKSSRIGLEKQDYLYLYYLVCPHSPLLPHPLLKILEKNYYHGFDYSYRLEIYNLHSPLPPPEDKGGGELTTTGMFHLASNTFKPTFFF